MNTNEVTAKMKAKLSAFFETATQQDISALLQRTNYDFYKNVQAPAEDWFDIDFAVTETNQVLTVEIPAVMSIPHHSVPNRPIVFIGRDSPLDNERFTVAADHEGLALAA
jgi:hypothetical protein